MRNRSQDDILKALEKTLFRSVKYAYDVDGDLEYKGFHRDFEADTADGFWEIVKYIYNGSKDLIDKQVTRGVWDNRASLFT
jgi:hypothetical protein